MVELESIQQYQIRLMTDEAGKFTMVLPAKENVPRPRGTQGWGTPGNRGKGRERELSKVPERGEENVD